MAGQPVRTASDFNKLVKSKPVISSSGTSQEVPHVEVIVRRLPFAQVYHLKREVDGQPLGLVMCGNTSEVRGQSYFLLATISGASALTASDIFLFCYK